MVQVQSTKVKKPPETAYSIINDLGVSKADFKEKNQKCTSILGIIVGATLTACILYVALHGRTLILYPKCSGENGGFRFYKPNGNLDKIPSKFFNESLSRYLYVSPHGSILELQNARDYGDWLASLGDKITVNSFLSEPPSNKFTNWQPISKQEDPSTLQDQNLSNKVANELPVITKATSSLRKQIQVASDRCVDMPLSLRFDCIPGGVVDQKTCEERGCCWQPLDELPRRAIPHPSPRLSKPSHGTSLDDLPLNVPYCHYPTDYEGYRFVNYTQSVGYLERETESGYPFDVPLLKIEFLFETETRIRIKIQDAEQERWESPLPIKHKASNKAKEHAKHTEIDTLYSIEVRENDGAFTIFRKNTSLPLFDTRNVAPLIYADQFIQVSTHLPSEYVYGLGEHLNGLLLDTFWTRHVLWNLDNIPEPGKNLYGSHPFYLAMEPNGNAHGVFLHNSNAMDVVLQPTPALTFRTIGGILDMYVFLGPTPNDVVRQYTEVIGRPFLPPYWSLGYHQCRYGYESLNKTRAVWKRTRDAGIPFDVQWNDIDYMDQNKDFTYDQQNYKDLPNFVEEIHKVGMHYIPIVDPGISAAEPLHTYPPWDEGLALNVFVKNGSGMPFVGKVWNPVATTWPDFTHPMGTYYWGRQLLRYHSWVQIDGVWIDMNEPSNFWSGSYDGCPSSNIENPPYLPHVHGDLLYYHTICMSARHQAGLHYNVHNLYGLTETISTNIALQIIRNKRPFVISRSTFPGQGNYGGHWTGDVWSDWFNLWQSIPSILNFNMFGIPMVGADICGFNGNTTAALCLRWMQLGAFYPFSRNHNTDDAFDQDPVALGEDVVKASRNALETRYVLLPYLYSLFFRAHLSGDTVVRPLFFEFYEDKKTYGIDTQFMWGSGLMIVPVLQENVTEVKAYVPEGCWYNWYDGSPMPSTGDYVTLAAPNDVIPLLVRGGYILPMQWPGNTTTESRLNPMALSVALDEKKTANGEFFWDDGDSLDTVENQNYTHILFTAAPGSVYINVTVLGYDSPVNLNYLFVVSIENDVKSVSVDGVEVEHKYNETTKLLEIFGFERSLLTSFSVIWT